MPLYQFNSLNEKMKTESGILHALGKLKNLPKVAKAGLIFIIAIIASFFIAANNNTTSNVVHIGENGPSGNDHASFIDMQHDSSTIVPPSPVLKKKEALKPSTAVSSSTTVDCNMQISSTSIHDTIEEQKKTKETSFLWPNPSMVEWFGGSNEESPASLLWSLSPQFRFRIVDKSLDHHTMGQKVLHKSCSRVCELLRAPDASQINSLEQDVRTIRFLDLVFESSDVDSIMKGWSETKWAQIQVPQLVDVEDEGYKLMIDSNENAVLVSTSLLGMLNGLETFAQLFTESTPVLMKKKSAYHSPKESNAMINSFYLELMTLVESLKPKKSGGGVVQDSIYDALLSSLSSSVSLNKDQRNSIDTTGSSSSSDSTGVNNVDFTSEAYGNAVSGLLIEDEPALPWRGLMVDTARHFIPLSLLVNTLDTMKAVKLNVLHLHLSDSQSFPILFPDEFNTKHVNITKLGLKGSFPIIEHKSTKFIKANKNFIHNYDEFKDDDVDDKGGSMSFTSTSQLQKKRDFTNVYGYTVQDFRVLIKEAALRGIRVIPEVDVPAHSLSWGLAFPEIISKCDLYQKDKQSPTDIPALNPMKEETYEVVRAVIQAISDIFPDHYLHLGADEVKFSCWEEDEELMKWAADKNITSHGLFDYFEERVLAMTPDNKKVILWQGAVDQKLSLTKHYSPTFDSEVQDTSSTPRSVRASDASITIQPWKCWSGLNRNSAVESGKRGFAVIDSSCWYLDWSPKWNNYVDAAHVPAPYPPVLDQPPPPPLKTSVHRRRLNKKKDKVEEKEKEALLESSQRLNRPEWRNYLSSTNEKTTPLISDFDASSSTRINEIASKVLASNSTTTNELRHMKEQLLLLLLREKDQKRKQYSRIKFDSTNFLYRFKNKALLNLRENFNENDIKALKVRRRLNSPHLTSHMKKSGDYEMLLGGETSMWNENVDWTNFDCRVWPRAAAVAERLWKGSETIMSYRSSVRFMKLVELLKSRGVNTSPYEDKADGTFGNQQCPPLSPHFQRPIPLQNHYHKKKEKMTSPGSDFGSKVSIKKGKKMEKTHVDVVEDDDELDVRFAPLMPNHLSILQLNADDGGGGGLKGGKRLPSIIDWLSDAAMGNSLGPAIEAGMKGGTKTRRMENPSFDTKTKSTNFDHQHEDNADIDDDIGQDMLSPAIAVGFCELNGWNSKANGYLDITKSYLPKTPLIVSRAAEAGFAFSHIFSNLSHPYHIGLVSRSPIQVIAEVGKPHFERGLLHVRLPQEPNFSGRGNPSPPPIVKKPTPQDSTESEVVSKKKSLKGELTTSETKFNEGIDLIIVHLHAHDAVERKKEAEYIHDIVVKLNENGRPVMVMGDFNTLSRKDAYAHKEMKLLDFITQSNSKHFLRLKKKYTTTTTTTTTGNGGDDKLELAYEPMDVLLHSGLVDLCALQCESNSHITNPTSWFDESFILDKDSSSSSRDQGDSHQQQYEDCLKLHCPYTEPTSLKPDVAELPINISAPAIRVDFMLANLHFINMVQKNHVATTKKSATMSQYLPKTEVLINQHTATMSDHFPIRTQWKNMPS